MERNAHLVNDLLDLNAVESAEVIERRLPPEWLIPSSLVTGGDIRQKLGVPGLGIAPDRTPGWPTLRERFGYPEQERQQRTVDRKRNAKKALRQAKARLKSKRNNRKRRTPDNPYVLGTRPPSPMA